MMKVAAGRVVTLEYTVQLADGSPIDSTGACGPVTVMVGSGQLFPALEERLDGMVAGETRDLRIPAEDAYGPWHAELVRTLPRDRLPDGLELTVGADYRVTVSDGKMVRFRVVDVGAAEVQADFNPRGAGQDMHATVTVIAVRGATPAEERRGRV